jgi:hypothetical protein
MSEQLCFSDVELWVLLRVARFFKYELEDDILEEHEEPGISSCAWCSIGSIGHELDKIIHRLDWYLSNKPKMPVCVNGTDRKLGDVAKDIIRHYPSVRDAVEILRRGCDYKTVASFERYLDWDACENKFSVAPNEDTDQDGCLNPSSCT